MERREIEQAQRTETQTGKESVKGSERGVERHREIHGKAAPHSRNRSGDIAITRRDALLYPASFTHVCGRRASQATELKSLDSDLFKTQEGFQKGC